MIFWNNLLVYLTPAGRSFAPFAVFCCYDVAEPCEQIYVLLCNLVFSFFVIFFPLILIIRIILLIGVSFEKFPI